MQLLSRTARDVARFHPRIALRAASSSSGGGSTSSSSGASGASRPPSATQAASSGTAAATAGPALVEPPAQTSVADGALAPASRKPGGYPFAAIESKWQRHWLEHKTFRTPHITELDTSKPKFYALDMFPYPSGAGLHVGHPEGYTATDIVARLKRHQGYNVLHPIGFDAFGLPAEQFAIQTGTHPRDTTAKNCRRFREQLRSLGFSYDWDREISTTDPEYYRWTQWIFLQIFKQGLAYQAEVPVNWCPALGTVLANEEVIDGRSERGSHPVVRMPMRQWMLRITQFAQRLLDDLDGLDWDDSIKGMQRNWIGRSEGADVSFQVRGGAGATVAQDALLTIFGVTYMVVAPEYTGLDELVGDAHRPAVSEYVAAAASKSDLERTELSKQKTGVFTGSYAVNPATAEEIPIWVADYVLGGYGSGAIMAVPGHDTRDFEFAEAFDLAVKRVVQSPTEERPKLPYTGPGHAINSSNPAADLDLNQKGTDAAKAAAIDWLERRGVGRRRVNFKLRDWLFARQRYWGEPFPIIFPEGSQEPVAVPEDQLPLLLPDTDNFKPSGTPESPLSVIDEWVNTVDPASGRPARRETSTMPQWAGSCWYYLRYIDPRNAEALVDKEAEQYWMPVDLYVGGAEHAVLHLLYARFWHKVLYDLGVVSTPEPFQRLVSQGMILGEVEYTAFQDPDSGAWVPEDAPGAVPVRVDPAEVDKVGDGHVLRADPSVRVSSRAHKMSKSRGNVVNPDDVVAEYGADSLRLYEMFMGPLRDTKVWNTNGVEGVHRFLARAWRLFADGVTEAAPDRDQLRLLHLTIKRVTEETEAMRFNTGISAMMEFVNGATKWPNRPRAALEPFALLLSPYAPHLAEELWQALGHGETLTYAPWPVADEALLTEDTINLPVQINGKLRGTVEVLKTISQADALAAGTALDNVARQIEGKAVRKVIFVPGKILNIIVG